MHKIFTLFFCTLITLFHPSAKASAPSPADEACAAAARPKKSIIKSLCARAIGQEPPSILSRRGQILKLKNFIIWPDEINEEDRFYCAERIIDLELNLWPEEPAPHRIPKIVTEALKNRLSLRSLSHILLGYAPKKIVPAKQLALAIILDKNPTIDVNEKFIDYYGHSRLILHYAVEYGTAHLIPMLCERGATVDAVEDTSLETPLHKAVFKGSIDAIQELIRQGANPNARDHRGWTPLHNIACSYDAPIKTKILLAYGANPYTLTFHGETALDLARTTQREYCFPASHPLPEAIAYLEEFMATH